MIKELKFADEARESVLAGAKLMRDAVGATLGPRASNVAIERQYGVATIIHDGVKVASQIAGEHTFIDNQWQNVGAKLLYKAAQDTNNICGDGTTTSVILSYAILSEGHKLVSAGHNSRMLRRGILSAVDCVNQELTKLSKPIKTQEQKQQVATISAQDENIGKAIANAVKIVGDEGVITVDELGDDLSVDYKEGMQFDQGLIDQVWVTDITRGEAVLDNPAILVTDYTISEVSTIEPFLEKVVGQDKKGNVLILAKDVQGSALMFLAQNKTQSGFNLVPVKAPGVGDGQADYLQDVATLVGAKFISEKSGDLLIDIETSDLGQAEKVIVGATSTIIVNGLGASSDVKLRVKAIDEQLKKSDIDEFKKERLRERKSKLTNGIAIIHVGDDPERKEQVIDAISATKAAISEGVVPGGATAYLRVRNKIAELKDTLTSEEYFGAEVVYKALEAPLRMLVENSGGDAGAILDKVLASDKGYDVETQDLENLVEHGILDPVKVLKTALDNASKVATALLTTSVLITIKRKVDDTPSNS